MNGRSSIPTYGVEGWPSDVPHDKAMELIAKTLFTDRTTAAAWHTKPSWYAVASLDQTINPDLERRRRFITKLSLNCGSTVRIS